MSLKNRKTTIRYKIGLVRSAPLTLSTANLLLLGTKDLSFFTLKEEEEE